MFSVILCTFVISWPYAHKHSVSQMLHFPGSFRDPSYGKMRGLEKMLICGFMVQNIRDTVIYLRCYIHKLVYNGYSSMDLHNYCNQEMFCQQNFCPAGQLGQYLFICSPLTTHVP